MIKNNRDDFPLKVKQTLAQRCAYRCSNPDCRIVTEGAHSNPIKSISIGEACHIEAASPGGPRYNKSMTSEERKSVNNGIWLCSKCSNLIDQDVNRYTVEVLKQWKSNADNDLSSSNDLILTNNRLRIIGITNTAGGTGKSIVCGLLSIAIARTSKKKVLVISAVPYDHALITIGIDVKANNELSNCKIINFMDIQIFKSPYESKVDAISFSMLDNIARNQILTYGKTNLSIILNDLVINNQYDYIVCDCGSGYNSDITLEVMLYSSDIIIPIGDNLASNSGIDTLSNLLNEAGFKGDIHYLHSISPFSRSQKFNDLIRDERLKIIENLSKKSIIINELTTVIPRRKSIDDCLWKNESVFASIKARDVANAYEKLAYELLATDR